MRKTSNDIVILPDDYKRAISIQSACNLSGIVFEFAKIMEKICRAGYDKGTAWKNTHPICRLYAEQIAFLTKALDYDKAYNICKEKSEELPNEKSL